MRKWSGKQKAIAVLVGAGVVAAGVAAAVVIPQSIQQSKEASYVAQVRLGGGSFFDGVSDKAIARSLDQQCKEISQGWDLGEAMDAANTNWEPDVFGSSATKAEYLTAVKTEFQAAQAIC